MNFTKTFSKLAFMAKQHAPEIMIGAGILAGAGALYFTVRGTLKLNKILDDHDERVNNVKKSYIPEEELEKVEDNGEPIKFDIEVTEEEKKSYKRDLTREYAKTVGTVALAYAPAAALALASAGLSIGAYGIMNKRVAVALTALESVTASFAEYRQRVKDRYGEEAENDILLGKTTEHVAVEKELKNGKTKLVDEEQTSYKGSASTYGRTYSINTAKNFLGGGDGRAYNKTFIENIEEAANLTLRRRGYIFLNEVYQLLGFDETPEGQLVGWLENTENGDGEVKFAIKEVLDDKNEDNDVWYLDFNVDGVIFDKISLKM